MTGHVIEVVHVSECPSLEAVLALLRSCLDSSGYDAAVVVREGTLASPTVLVDGIDVVTGLPPTAATACRIDLPTESQILTALERTQT